MSKRSVDCNTFVSGNQGLRKLRDSTMPNSFKVRAVDPHLRVPNTPPQQQNPKTLIYQKRSVVLNTFASDNPSHSGLGDPPNPRSPRYAPSILQETEDFQTQCATKSQSIKI